VSEILDALAALPASADYVLGACVIGLAVAAAGLAYSMRLGPDDRLPDEPTPRREWRIRNRDRRDHDA
jgi:hypothetical protein